MVVRQKRLQARGVIVRDNGGTWSRIVVQPRGLFKGAQVHLAVRPDELQSQAPGRICTGQGRTVVDRTRRAPRRPLHVAGADQTVRAAVLGPPEILARRLDLRIPLLRRGADVAQLARRMIPAHMPRQAGIAGSRIALRRRRRLFLCPRVLAMQVERDERRASRGWANDHDVVLYRCERWMLPSEWLYRR